MENLGKVLLIDDERNIKADRVARTFDDGITALRDEGPWDLLYLDHDFGDPDPAKNGYGVLCWLEEHTECTPADIKLVTSNASVRAKMLMVIDKLLGRL